MEHRSDEGLLGELSQNDALELFKTMATSQNQEDEEDASGNHTDVHRDGILGERFYHKFQYMMENWDSEDKQFNMALGNFDDMNEYVQK